MSYPIFAAVFYICLQFHDNNADEAFQISKTRMTWKDTDRHCRNKTGSCLVTKQAAEWRRLGTPSGVKLHTPVWVGARYLEKLVWELNQGVSVDFFQFVGCYSIASRTEHLHDGVHAPYQCYERCGRTTMYMFLQNEVCFCTNNISIYRSHDMRCDTTCSDSLHTCGGKGDYFSGFRVMKNIILDARTWDAPCFFGKLQDEDKQKVLFINGTSDDSNRYELILSSEFRVAGIGSTINCTKRPRTFVNAKQHESLNHFGTSVINTPSDRIYNSIYSRFLNETLWLPLYRVGHLYWSNGKRFAESIRVSKGKVYECVSAQFDYNGSVEFESRSCNDVLDFICSCDIITEGYKAVHGESESKKDEAIIAAAIGLLSLLVLVIVLVVLIVLQSHGKLRIQTVSGLTSKQEHPSRPWDRASNAQTIDDETEIVIDSYSSSTVRPSFDVTSAIVPNPPSHFSKISPKSLTPVDVEQHEPETGSLLADDPEEHDGHICYEIYSKTNADDYTDNKENAYTLVGSN